MARVSMVFASGTIGNTIFYERNGRPCVRSKPASVQQSPATQRAGKRFGASKTLSRLLRQCLGGLLPHTGNKPLMYTVDRGALQWMKIGEGEKEVLTSLPGFSCTDGAEDGTLFPLPVTASLAGNTLLVSIPLTPSAPLPVKGREVLLTLMVSCIHPEAGAVRCNEVQSIELQWPPETPGSTTLSFNVVVEPGVFIALSAALSYEQAKGSNRSGKGKGSVKSVAVLEGWYCGA